MGTAQGILGGLLVGGAAGYILGYYLASSPMIRLAERVGREPSFLGYHLVAMRKEYAQSFDEQAAAFGLDAEALANLALCRMPATALDLATIADAAFGMEAENLGELLQLDLLG
jgi:hypothetical protein